MQKGHNMNDRQEKFCLNYLKVLNIAEAAKLSGYSVPSGYKLMKRAEIKNYLEQELNRLKKAQIAEVEEILKELTKISRDKNAETKDRIKALELLGKTYGIFKPNVAPEYPPVIIMGEAEIKD